LLGLGLKAPRRRPLPAPRGEGRRDQPLAGLLAQRVPHDVVHVDAARAQSGAGTVAQGDATVVREDRALGADRHELTLGEDRSLEAADLLHRPPGAVGDLLGAQARADEGLHVAWTQAALDLDLELAQPRAIASSGRAQGLVEGQAVPNSLGVGEQEVVSALVDADESEVLHVHFSR
jgi:hypothetical protein